MVKVLIFSLYSWRKAAYMIVWYISNSYQIITKPHRIHTEPTNRLANFMSNHTAILKKQLLFSLSFLFVVSISFSTMAQNTSTSKDWSMQELYESAAHSMVLRGIGPAAMGGRISDIKVDPNHPSTWYVAVGSGGVWKTVNSGTTWEAILRCRMPNCRSVWV